MNRPISLLLLIGGIILIAYGVSSSGSVGSGLSRLFTGAPTNKTILLLAGGSAAAVLGLVGVLRGSDPA